MIQLFIYLKLQSVFFPAIFFQFGVNSCHQRVPFHWSIYKFAAQAQWNKTITNNNSFPLLLFFLPVKVELVKMRTILELTGGSVPRDPAKIRSTVWSSILFYFKKWDDSNNTSQCAKGTFIYARHFRSVEQCWRKVLVGWKKVVIRVATGYRGPASDASANFPPSIKQNIIRTMWHPTK